MCFVHGAAPTTAGASQRSPPGVTGSRFASMSAASRRRRESSSPVRDADSSPSGGSAVRNDPRNDGERAGSGDHLTQPEYESFWSLWAGGARWDGCQICGGVALELQYLKSSFRGEATSAVVLIVHASCRVWARARSSASALSCWRG